MQGIENGEKFVLKFVFAGPVLDIVDQEDIHFVAVEVAHFGDALVAEALHVLLGEVFGSQVADSLCGVFFQDVVTDRLEQMGLAQAGGAVNEKRIVLGAVGVAGYRQGGVECQLGLVARHEVFKTETAR